MKKTKVTNLLSVLLASATLVVTADRAAAITIGFEPADATFEIGQSLAVDIVFSELDGEIVSAYDLAIDYDATVLAVVMVTFTTQLGDEALFESLSGSDLATPGFVDLAQVSFLSDGELLALQGGDRSVVATLLLEAVATGTSGLGFSFGAFDGVWGLGGLPLALDATPATVEVVPATVPEPSTGLLCGLGLAWLAAARRA